MAIFIVTNDGGQGTEQTIAIPLYSPDTSLNFVQKVGCICPYLMRCYMKYMCILNYIIKLKVYLHGGILGVSCIYSTYHISVLHVQLIFTLDITPLPSSIVLSTVSSSSNVYVI